MVQATSRRTGPIRKFTGKHMLGVLLGGFGIVIGVNVTMAALAVSSFSGVVVENSYVASQHFNRWLKEAREAKALGWEAQIDRDGEGHLVVRTSNIPAGATLHVDLRRPLGAKNHLRAQLVTLAPGIYRSASPLETGRWIARITVESAGKHWREERYLS